MPEDTLQLTEPTNIFVNVTNLFGQSLKLLITDINVSLVLVTQSFSCDYSVVLLIVRAGRYDQKFISRYFSKLYRFHGI